MKGTLKPLETGSAVVTREPAPVAPVTPVMRWTVWDEMNTLRRQMDEMFGRAFGFGPLTNLPHLGITESLTYEPPFDLYELDDEIQAVVTLPGYLPADIQVEATAEKVTIRGERKALVEEDKAVPHRTSGVAGQSRFQIIFTPPAEIDPNSIKAQLENGVLTLTMPKVKPAVTAVTVPVK